MTEFGLLQKKGIIGFTDGFKNYTKFAFDVSNYEFCK